MSTKKVTNTNFAEVINRIMELKGFSKEKEVAEALGMKTVALSERKSRNAAPEDKIRLWCAREFVNPNWVLYGEGDKLFSPSGEICACRMVDIYSMVEAGPGAEPEWHDPIDRQVIPTKLLKAAIRPVQVRGRSMEPSIMDGAIIGVDLQDRQVVEGEVYAIMLPYAGAAVKRLYPLPDGVLIRSDNKEFPEVKIRREEIQEHFILGRVKWVLQEF